MKILVVHNEYGKFSGEEAVVYNLCRLLEEQGHSVVKLFRSSAEIADMFIGRTRAFFSGIYSFSSKKAMRRLIAKCKPDIVHIHNVFPLISPSVLGECRKAGVPVVMTVHNYRLVCPNGLHMLNGHVCEKCCGGREYQCLLNNCEGSLSKSMGYFLRNYVVRKLKLYKDNVSMYACLTEFQRQRLIDAGFTADKLAVIPNMAKIQEYNQKSLIGEFVGYIGRMSPEKGIATLIDAAKANRDIPFKAAGGYDLVRDLLRQAPDNFDFLGNIPHENTPAFYQNSRFIILCSTWFEGFPMILVEAMVQAKPVIASRIGGIPEIVDDGVTGLLFEPGNSEDLAEKIQYLWDRPDLCRKMGQAGREKALREYSPGKYYKRLMAIYEKAIELGPGG